jgi:hypothetical protein
LNLLRAFLWISIGLITAYLTLATQRWVVNRIDPAKPVFSQRIVIGSAVIRWIFIGLILIIGLSYSIFALLMIFGSFMICRLFIVWTWDRQSIAWQKQKTNM